MSDFYPVQYDPDDPLHVLMMGYEDNPALAHWGPGKRAYYILHFVTHGHGFFCGNKVRAGQGFLIHPSHFHEYHAATQDGWHYFWMILSAEIARRYVLPFLQTDENGIFSYRCDAAFMKTVREHFQRETPMGHIEALRAFFATVSRLTAESHGYRSAPQYHIQAAKVYIGNNLHKKLTVKAVADAIHIDDRYFYKIFTAQEGVAPKVYIDRCKIAEAETLLCSSRMAVTEIALVLGFESVCTFSKFFSARTGKSPTAVRRAHTINR